MKCKPLLLLALLSTSSVYAKYSPPRHDHAHSVHAVNRLGFYVQGNIGASFPAAKFGDKYNSRSKPTSVFSAGVGYIFNDVLNADVIISHRYKFKHDSANGLKQNISSTSVMLTGYYTFPIKAALPYIAAGLGAAFNNAGDLRLLSIDNTYQGSNSKNFAWQVGTGVKFHASESVMFDFAYRYVNSGAFKTSTHRVDNPTNTVFERAAIQGKLRTHEVTFGIVYKL